MTAVSRSLFRPQCGRIWSFLARQIVLRSSHGLHRSRRVQMELHTSQRLPQNGAPRSNILLVRANGFPTPRGNLPLLYGGIGRAVPKRLTEIIEIESGGKHGSVARSTVPSIRQAHGTGADIGVVNSHRVILPEQRVEARTELQPLAANPELASPVQPVPFRALSHVR